MRENHHGPDERPAILVKVFSLEEAESRLPALEGLPVYRGPSYCDALRLAGETGPLLVKQDSIRVCRWSPPALGLKEPETDFEKSREPRLGGPTAAVLLAPENEWPREAGEPDAVIIRADRFRLAGMLKGVDREKLFLEPAGIDKTALSWALEQGGNPWKARLVKGVNLGLEKLNRVPGWRRLTLWAFRREWSTRVLNFLLDRAMANMSVCRNATVIPLLTGKVNISHFCTGGIAWGMNSPHHLVCGIPWRIYQELQESAALQGRE